MGELARDLGERARRARKLRDETDGNIQVAGSATLVKTLLENDLVDQWNLMVFPTILGSGKRLFADEVRAAS